MATTTGIGADREPRIALGVELEHTRPGSASVADIAIALDVLTAIVTDHPGETGPLDVDDTDIWIKALVVFEYDGAPLIVGGGGGGLRSWRVDGTPGPLSVDDTNMPKIEALVVFEYDGAPRDRQRRRRRKVAQLAGGRHPGAAEHRRHRHL